MKKTARIFSFALVLAMCFLLAACSTNANSASDTTESNPAETASSSEPSGTITVLALSEYHDSIQAAIDAYMEEYPDVTVNLEDYPYAQYNDAVSIKLGSQDNSVDVVLTDCTMVSNYAYKGWIASEDSYYTEDEKNEFVTALQKSSMYDGKFYAAPLCNSCQVLWYNKDLLDAAGIEYPSEDPADRLTWEQVVEMSQKIMEASGDPSVYGLTFEQVDRPSQVLPLAWSLGADAFASDGITVDGYLNSDTFTKAMQWYSDIHNVYNIAPKGTSPSDSVGLFTAGKIAFLCANIFDYATFEGTEGLNYGYTPFPYFADGNVTTPTDSWHIALSSFSQNPDTAMSFIKYFSLGKGNDVFLKARGALAARTEILDSYTTDSAYNEFPMSVFHVASYEAQNTAYPRPVTLAYGEFETIMDSTLSDIRNGADVTETLNSAVSQLETQIEMYK